MFNKFVMDGTRFGRPNAQVDSTAYVVPVLMYEGLDIKGGEVCLDAVGLAVAWRFAGEDWNHWVQGDAVASLHIQLESVSDSIGAYAVIRHVLGQWACFSVTHGISTDEGTYASLSDAISSLKEWDFTSYSRVVQGYC